SQIYVFNKSNLYSGGAGAFTLFSASGIGLTQTPSITYDNTISTIYLVQDFNGNSGGSGFIRLYTITGPVGAEVLNFATPETAVLTSTPNPWDSSHPIVNGGFVPQNPAPLTTAQFSTRIMNNDSRIQNVVYRNGTLWFVHTVFLPAGGLPTRRKE